MNLKMTLKDEWRFPVSTSNKLITFPEAVARSFPDWGWNLTCFMAPCN